jgi:hypothetical protein
VTSLRESYVLQIEIYSENNKKFFLDGRQDVMLLYSRSEFQKLLQDIKDDVKQHGFYNFPRRVGEESKHR